MSRLLFEKKKLEPVMFMLLRAGIRKKKKGDGPNFLTKK